MKKYIKDIIFIVIALIITTILLFSIPAEGNTQNEKVTIKTKITELKGYDIWMD